MGWTKVWQYSKIVKCPLENQYFASYIVIAAVYFERICSNLPGPFRYKKYVGPLRVKGTPPKNPSPSGFICLYVYLN